MLEDLRSVKLVKIFRTKIYEFSITKILLNVFTKIKISSFSTARCFGTLKLSEDVSETFPILENDTASNKMTEERTSRTHGQQWRGLGSQSSSLCKKEVKKSKRVQENEKYSEN